MYKHLSLLLAMGCVGAVASSVTNYDLLGRKGSKMNSPMVYRNVDYSKIKKGINSNQPIATPALMKTGVGLDNNAVALEGRYNNQGWDNGHYFYFLRAYFADNGRDQAPWPDLVTRGGYGGKANNYFIKNYFLQPNSHVPANPSAPTFTGASGYSINWRNISLSNNMSHESTYESGVQNVYKSVAHVRDDESLLDKESFNDNYGNINRYNVEWGDVGVYINSYARPGYMKRDDNIKYYVDPSSGSFKTMPGHEILASKLYKVVQNISSRSIIYSTTKDPENPSQTMTNPSQTMTSRPTPIYIGLRSHLNQTGFESNSVKYTAAGLDNYIYDNRTIEFVASGNSVNNKNFAIDAHAVNAITVGAVDAKTKKVVRYMPNVVPKYCPAASKPCTNNVGLVTGSHKPEVYGYTHFYTNDSRTEYMKNGKTLSYDPFHDGSETAAATLAGMVSDLLATNSFYRWHPEVVKALLMTSSDGLVPTYSTVIPKRGATDGVVHESRYWTGDINKLTSLINTNKKEIWFSVPRPSWTSRYVAAISWLSRGDDIVRLGKLPQNFNIKAYATDYDIYEKYDAHIHGQNKPAVNFDNPGTFLKESTSDGNAFKKMSFAANSAYITFCITLARDESSSDYKGQIALGFDMASY